MQYLKHQIQFQTGNREILTSDHIHHDPFIQLTLTTWVFSGSWRAGSVHKALYGTAWTYICGNILEVFNHSCYAVTTFIVQLQQSFLREICSQWQIVSLIEHFHHLFETTPMRLRCAVLFKHILHLPQLAWHSFTVIVKAIQGNREIGVFIWFHLMSVWLSSSDCKLLVIVCCHLYQSVSSQLTQHPFLGDKTISFAFMFLFWSFYFLKKILLTFTFSHLADAFFFQSDLQMLIYQ